MSAAAVTGDDDALSQEAELARPTPFAADLLASTELLKGLTSAQISQLRSVCRERHFASGELILREGEPDPFVYVLVDGRAQLTKSTSAGDDQMILGELAPGDVLGELKIVDPQPSSASVAAITPVTAVAVDLEAFAGAAELADARVTVLANIGKILAERLRVRTSQGADAMQHELDESRARAYAGRFIVLILAMLATYQLGVSALQLVPVSLRPHPELLSFGFVLWTCVPFVLALRHSPFPLASYGLTWQGGGRAALQALLWTAPILLLALIIKLAEMHWVPAMAHRGLLDPAASFNGGPFNRNFYIFLIILYAIHTPLQEFVARAGLQGTLQLFMPALPGRVNWKAILVSNLLFASAHTCIGFWFAVVAFVPGLFWGWMFAKQRSLIGVIVSHAVLGLSVFFLLGLQAIFIHH